MCIIDERDDWYWDCTNHEKVVWIEDIRGLTLRQAICKLFNTTSSDIKNSPWLWWICWEPITNFNTVIDDSFHLLHITKRWKKSKGDEFFCPNNLTIEEYTFCSDYRLITIFNPFENDSL